MSGHVLLIEDEAEVRRSISQVLELKGYTVTVAERVEEALEQMRTGEAIDVILLDLMMPDMSGWEVRERQLEAALAPEAAVVILSGAAEDLSGEQRAIDADESLVKPVRPAELYEVLERYCGG